MKNKFIFLLFFLISGIGRYDANAQDIVIQTNDGNESIKALNSLQSFSFSGNDLLLNLLSGNEESFNLSNIRKIYFAKAAAVSNTLISEMSFYPNPVGDFISFKNLQDNTTVVKIFRLDGMMLLNEQITSGDNSIDVSSFPMGLYILNFNNQTKKFIKK